MHLPPTDPADLINCFAVSNPATVLGKLLQSLSPQYENVSRVVNSNFVIIGIL